MSVIIIQWWFVVRRHSTVLFREQYSANSLIVSSIVTSKSGLFHQLTRFELDVWTEHLLDRLARKIKNPLNYELWNDLDDLDIQFNKNKIMSDWHS